MTALRGSLGGTRYSSSAGRRRGLLGRQAASGRLGCVEHLARGVDRIRSADGSRSPRSGDHHRSTVREHRHRRIPPSVLHIVVMAERDRRRVKVMDRFHLVAVPTHDTTRPSGSKVCPEQNRWCLVVGLEVAPADGSITNDPLACRARLAGHARGSQGPPRRPRQAGR